jgi:hypothetical protein
MDTQHTSRGLTQRDDSLRPVGQRRSGLSARSVRWIKRALSAGLLTAATVMGVELGMDAPTVSPVSPAAIAEQAALLSGDADVPQVQPVQRGGGRHQRRGRS